MGFKSNIGGVTIQAPRAYGSFYGGSSRAHGRNRTGRGGDPQMSFEGARSPNGGFVNVEE